MKKAAIITGAGSGIGAAIAEELSSQGIYTVMLGRNTNSLSEVAHRISSAGNPCSFYSCDVTKSGEIHDVLQKLQPELSGTNLILVNNAGYGGPFLTTNGMSEEEWDTIFATNVKASFLFCKMLLPLMQHSGWGRVVNIASVYGSVGGALSAAYAASKHALVGYTRSLAAEWGRWGITCNTVSPGFISTRMGASEKDYEAAVVQQIPVLRQGTPAEVAKLVAFLSGNDSSYINGADLVVDGGLISGRSFLL